MPNPSMSNIPGMGAMTDTLDFMKNLWGGMNIPGMGIPGMVMPTLSVEEINKQISDLKAVESWLTLNMNMLRNTIQALEVQSATIATLQSMSATLSAAIKPEAARTASAPAARQETYSSSFTKAAEKPQSESAAAFASTETPPSDKIGDPAAAATAGIANPAIWWNMLQDQFKQAVNTALASEKPESVSKTPAASKPAGKKPATARKPVAPRSPTSKSTAPRPAAPKSAAGK